MNNLKHINLCTIAKELLYDKFLGRVARSNGINNLILIDKIIFLKMIARSSS